MKNILMIAFILLSNTFALLYFISINKIKKISKEYSKLFIDNAVMQEYIDIIKSKEADSISDEILDKENFIKFLSDSRDWAFGYIEDVQKTINKFVNDIEKDIDYFDKYGDTLSTERPDYDSLKRISVAYKELKNVLPNNKEIVGNNE